MYKQFKVSIHLFLFFNLALQGCSTEPKLKYNLAAEAVPHKDQKFIAGVKKLAIVPTTVNTSYRTHIVTQGCCKSVPSHIALASHAFTAFSGETVTFLQAGETLIAKVEDHRQGKNPTTTFHATRMLNVVWANPESSPETILPILAKQPTEVHRYRIHVVQDYLFLGSLGLPGGTLEEKESKQQERGSLTLYDVVVEGNLEAVKQMLKMGYNPNRGSWGVTPLYIAVKKGYLAILQLLLENGADLHISDSNGDTPLHIAAIHGHLDVVGFLLAMHANVHSVNYYKDTALHGAAENGHLAVVQLLLNKGADPNSTNENDDTPLHWAARNGHLEVVQCLLDKGADPNKASIDGVTPLHEAARKGYLQVVELLLQRDSKPNICNHDEDSPLYWAAENGHIAVVQLLLAKGADPNKANIHAYTPLYRAAENGHLKVVELLLAKNANPNGVDNFDESPLHLAASNDHVAVVQCLLDKGADPNKASIDRVTPLHNAAGKGHANLVQLLLDKGADPNKADINGATPLHWAADAGSLSIISILLKAGAATNAQNKVGDSFMHIIVARNLNLCLQGIKIIENDNALLLAILKKCSAHSEDLNLANIGDSFSIIVDYVKGLDCSLKNKQGQTIETLLKQEKEKLTLQDFEEICKSLEKHKQPGRWGGGYTTMN